MKQLSAEAKHHILLEYAAGDPTRSFAVLAHRHGISGGRRVLQSWHARWDGTAASLQRRAVAGRPRALSKAEVQQHVCAPIRRANRAYRAVKYTQLLPRVQQSTGVELSVRTLRRYGKEECGAKSTRGKKRTAAECEHPHAQCMLCVCVLRAVWTHKL